MPLSIILIFYQYLTGGRINTYGNIKLANAFNSMIGYCKPIYLTFASMLKRFTTY